MPSFWCTTLFSRLRIINASHAFRCDHFLFHSAIVANVHRHCPNVFNKTKCQQQKRLDIFCPRRQRAGRRHEGFSYGFLYVVCVMCTFNWRWAIAFDSILSACQIMVCGAKINTKHIQSTMRQRRNMTLSQGTIPWMNKKNKNIQHRLSTQRNKEKIIAFSSTIFYLFFFSRLFFARAAAHWHVQTYIRRLSHSCDARARSRFGAIPLPATERTTNKMRFGFILYSSHK